VMETNLSLRETVDLTRRDAIARPTTFDAKARTIDAVVATNAPVQRRDEQGPYLEILDVSGADLAALRGVLNSHSQHGLDAVIGTVESARVDGNELVATLRMSSRPEVEPIVSDIRDGVINSLSVGYEVSEWADGTTADGQRTRTAKRWAAREVSFVAVSADPNARTRGGRTAINRQIRELATRAGCTEIADDLIDRSASIEEARSAMLDNLLTRGRTSIVPSRHNDTTLENPEVFHQAVGEALYVRINPSHKPSGPAQQFVGARIDELARVCLTRAGISTMGMNANTLITRALNTTSDFANILANTVGRTMREAYQVAPSGIRKVGRETSAQDFRAKTRIMLDSSGFLLAPVNEHGEFTQGNMIDSAESYAVTTFGRIFGITRQALVNDDLGAFTDLTRRLGQAAAVFENSFRLPAIVSNLETARPRLSLTTLRSLHN
jgi:HK97 family phage prohead protease